MLSFNLSVVDVVLAIGIFILLWLEMKRTPTIFSAEPKLSRETRTILEEPRENTAMPKPNISRKHVQVPRQAQKPIVLLICPQCKSRIPSESKFCLECGTPLELK